MLHVCGDVSNSKYRATCCMYVVMLVTVSIELMLHVFGDVSNSKYRATYCMYVVMLVTVSIELHAACMW